MTVTVTLYEPTRPTPVAEPDPAPTAVPELAVQLAWVREQFHAADLRTTDGDAVDVIRPGTLNLDSGPDVRNAIVRIGGLVWAGDIEIHRTSAEWSQHSHDSDAAYDRVVLHVVLSADAATGAVRRADGTRVPELVLLPHLSVSLSRLVSRVHLSTDGPPCATDGRSLPAPPPGWLAGLGRARLREKADVLGDAYRTLPDLGELLARSVFRALGYEANAGAMETLAERMDLAKVRSLPDDDARAHFLLTAAGLNDAGLFSLDAAATPPMPREAWRRGGRPANAPRTRIVQAARLLAPGQLLGRGGLDASRHLTDAPALLDALRRPADGIAPRLGASRARDIALNAVLPVWLLDGDQREDPSATDRVARVAAALPSAKDRIVRAYAADGIVGNDALEAQGVHRLARTLCAEGRCARCAIGQRIAPGLVG